MVHPLVWFVGGMLGGAAVAVAKPRETKPVVKVVEESGIARGVHAIALAALPASSAKAFGTLLLGEES